MGLARLTLALTGLATLATLATAGLFLTAWYDLGGLRDLASDAALIALFAALALVLVAFWMRLQVASWLLERDDLDALLRYALPRATPSWTVGRNEAARNRFAAAEALRRSGRPREAIALLDTGGRPPSSADLNALLRLARAAALADLKHNDQARALADDLAATPLSASARALLQKVRDGLG